MAEFREVVSGAQKERAIFDRAVLLCRKRRATLLVLNLDRLSRRMHVISDLMRQNVDVKIVNMPNVSATMMCILSALAADELDRIRARTRLALQARKRRRGGVPEPMHSAGASRATALYGSRLRQYNRIKATIMARRAAKDNRARGLKLESNVDELMMAFPQIGVVSTQTVSRWVRDPLPDLAAMERDLEACRARSEAETIRTSLAFNEARAAQGDVASAQRAEAYRQKLIAL